MLSASITLLEMLPTPRDEKISDGLITFMNPLAESFTGWDLEQALNRPLSSVFRVMNEKPDKLQKISVRKILKTIEFPWPVATIVLQHHKRMDGSGYPSGLKGKDILLEAKILAAADVIEAMATHRPYRPALSIEEALKEISMNKGKLYDRKVAEACIKVFQEKKIKLG